MAKTALRRPRAVIIDDDIVVMALLRTYLHLRGYDVLAYREPRVCPVYDDETECSLKNPCADVMLIDFSMPRMNGVDILKAQSARKCRLASRNKALITGYSDLLSQSIIDGLGCAFFEKPFDFNLLAAWLDDCEQGIDLSQPLGVKRKEKRHPCNAPVQYKAQTGPDVLTGVVLNMSTSGICLQINKPVVREETITIYPAQTRHSRTASVKWLKDIGNGSYVAGLHHH